MYNDVSVKHKKKIILFIIMIWQNVSILIESTADPSKNTYL